MRRGRKPKPTELKRLAGNPGKRALNAGEPRPARRSPTRPAHLNAEARKAWNWLKRTLEDLRLLAASDVAIMTLYCETWAEYVKVRQKVDEFGLMSMNDTVSAVWFVTARKSRFVPIASETGSATGMRSMIVIRFELNNVISRRVVSST